MADPSDPPTFMRMRNFNSDLSGGDDFSLALVNAGSSNNHMTVTIAQGATETSYCWTDDVWSPPNAGSFANTHWQASDWDFSIQITDDFGSNFVDIRQRVCRVSTSGTLIESQPWTTGFTATIATHTEGPFSYAWGKGALGDRIRWDIEFTETDGTSGSQAVEIKRNDPDTGVTVGSWWKIGMTPVAPGLTGFMPNRQTSRRKRM